MTKLNYYAIELHTHTIHSDGSLSPKDLVDHMKDFGYDGFFISDHNTMSALEEVYENKLDEDIAVYRAVEWTTFYGHIVILGPRSVGDWTRLTTDNLTDQLAEFRKRDHIAAGIAHPFAIGNPLCTGCHFEFQVEDWSCIDYFELANGPNPQDIGWNERAYRKWRDMLVQGHRLAAVSGRDLHNLPGLMDNFAITMIGLEGDLTKEGLVGGIRSGQTYMTLGPLMDLEISNGENINLGSSIAKSDLALKISLRPGDFLNYDKFNIGPRDLRVINKDQRLYEGPISYGKELSLDLRPEPGPV